jgi:hypothetical protein
MLGVDLPNVVVNTLAYEPTNRTLLAGTYGRSVFAYSLPDGISAVGETVNVGGLGELVAPWPNPSTGSTTFGFAARHDVNLTLEVFDLAGRRLWRHKLSATGGQTAVVGWNGRDSQGHELPSGVYLVRALNEGRVIGNRTVVLQR